MSPRILARLIMVAGGLTVAAALLLPGTSSATVAAAPVASDGVGLTVTIPSPDATPTEDPTDDPTGDPTDDPTDDPTPTPTTTVQADDSGPLPTTGPAVLSLVAAGVVLVLVGVVMRTVGRRRRAS